MVTGVAMFGGFEKETDSTARKRFAASTGVSLVFFAALAIAFVLLASEVKEEPEKSPIEVTFRKPVAQTEPAPKPPPPPKPKPKPKPKHRKKRVARASKSKGNSSPSIPTTIPDGELEEGDAADFDGTDAIPEVVGPGGGQPDPEPDPDPEPEGGPIILPERATPPRPRNTNRRPTYPEKARKEGLEGTVILKVVVDESGAIGDIKVLRGEEPFVGAALAVVREWDYAPALVNGRKTSVYRIIKVPFRLGRS